MKKKEFLQELKIALDDTMPEEDIQSVLESYETMFYNGFLDGKEEEIIAMELGSPARIVKGILSVTEEEEDASDTGDAVTQALVARFLKTDPKIFGMSLASMKGRTLAYLTDGMLFTVVGTIVTTLPTAVYHLIQMVLGNEPNYVDGGAYVYIFGDSGAAGLISPFLILVFLGAVNLATAFFLWRTDGYTPGKKLFHIRVLKLDGTKIKWTDAFLRDVCVKCLLNSLTTGFLNGISFVWGCATVDRKTVHDAIAKTVVVSEFTKEELEAMKKDKKYRKQKKEEKRQEKQQKRMKEREAGKKEKQRKKVQPKPKTEKQKEKEWRKQEEVRRKIKQQEQDEHLKTNKWVTESETTLSSIERAGESDKSVASMGGRSLNAEELATIERIKANLEEQRRKTEQELFGEEAEQLRQKSKQKEAERKGPTIIFKDHEKN